MNENLLARIKCQRLFCEHDNETSSFVEDKGFIDCVTESESNLKIWTRGVRHGFFSNVS